MPEISVIICTYNRENYLKAALNALAVQVFPENDFEIIVVDNNSGDNTARVCELFEKENSRLSFIRVLEKNPGLSNARNRGIRESSSEIVAFMDDDALPLPDFVEKISQCLKSNPEINYFGGKVIPLYESGQEPDWMSRYLEKLVSKVDLGEKSMLFPGKSYPVGCNMIFRKFVFERYGYFNPDLQQRSDDKYIYHLLKSHGENPFYCPDIIVYHNIENWRVSKENVLKLALRNGIEERIRVKELVSPKGLSKLFEYTFKLVASVIFFILFTLRGKSLNGKYIFLVFLYSLKGFLQKPELSDGRQ